MKYQNRVCFAQDQKSYARSEDLAAQQLGACIHLENNSWESVEES